MVSIIPGIENFAPERTETSSGLSVDPSVAPAAFSSFLTCSSISRSMAAGIFCFLLVVDVADLGGDRESGRHRQPGVGHLGEAGPLPPSRSFMLRLPSALPAPKK